MKSTIKFFVLFLCFHFHLQHCYALVVFAENACDETYGSVVGILINGGCAPYDVYLDGEQIVFETMTNYLEIPNVLIGNHTIMVEDQSGCTAEDAVTVDSPLQWSLNNYECTTNNNGVTTMNFSINFFGGNPIGSVYNVTYPDGTTAMNAGVANSMYEIEPGENITFTISDGLGCTIVASFNCQGVVQDCSLPIDVFVSSVVCESAFECDDFGGGPATYEVDFIVSGGFPPYTLLNAYTGEILEEGFNGGSYSVGGVPSAMPYKFIVVDARGCQASTSDEGEHCCLLTGDGNNWPPELEINDPAGTYATDFNPCVGEEVCFSVQTYDFGDLEMVFEYDDVAMPNANITINSGNDFGIFCWTPTEDEIGSHKIIARLYEHGERVMDEMEAIPLVFHINVQCGGNCPACPTCINAYNMGINNAVADCNGNILENGSIVVYPDPAATCPVVVRHPDGTGAYFSFRDLVPGDHSGLEVSLDGGYTYQTLPTMTVGLDQMNGEEEVLLSYNASSSPHDECTGSAVVSVFEGESNYQYSWSDCPNCNQADRTGLCAGTYTVMVTDTDTGCSNVIEIRIPLRVGHPYGGHGIIDFVLVPTVFSQSTDIIYQLGSSLNISLTIYTLQGQPIQTLINNEPKNAGQHVFPLDASILTNGTYLFSLETANEIRTTVGIKSN